MRRMALVNCDIYTGESVLTDHAVLISHDLIEAIVRFEDLPPGVDQIDLKGQCVAPGFIDVQVNGGGDLLFNDNPTVDQIVAIRDAHLKFGTTDFMITYISGPPDGMREAGRAVATFLEEGLEGVLGIHFEGPAINPQRAGVHDPAWIRSDPADELLAIYSIGRDFPVLVHDRYEVAG